MGGLALALFGFILFQLSELFSKYPAQSEIKFPWPYYVMRAVSYLLMGAGAILLITGLM